MEVHPGSVGSLSCSVTVQSRSSRPGWLPPSILLLHPPPPPPPSSSSILLLLLHPPPPPPPPCPCCSAPPSITHGRCCQRRPWEQRLENLRSPQLRVCLQFLSSRVVLFCYFVIAVAKCSLPFLLRVSMRSQSVEPSVKLCGWNMCFYLDVSVAVTPALFSFSFIQKTLNVPDEEAPETTTLSRTWQVAKLNFFTFSSIFSTDGLAGRSEQRHLCGVVNTLRVSEISFGSPAPRTEIKLKKPVARELKRFQEPQASPSVRETGSQSSPASDGNSDQHKNIRCRSVMLQKNSSEFISDLLSHWKQKLACLTKICLFF